MQVIPWQASHEQYMRYAAVGQEHIPPYTMGGAVEWFSLLVNLAKQRPSGES